jgi:pyruvate/2-oxoglutarate/acetoin dehydrogenase E1 component
MLPDVEEAVDQLFEEHDTICEVVCPIQLYPLDLGPIVESVRKTGRLLVVEEGLSFAAFGGEVAAQIMEQVPEILRAFRRLSSPSHPIPACGPLEKALLPAANTIIEAALEVLTNG